jgi:hypothetical protein
VFAFDQRAWAGAESYAAVAITSGVARHLALTTDGPLIHDREIDAAARPARGGHC